MVAIAIAGGTGKIGLTIADVLRENSKYKVIVLSRKAAESNDPREHVVVVDYSNVKALVDLFEAHSVHTVISTIQVNSPEAGASETSLVEAASQSKKTERFIASDWSVPVSDKRFELLQNAPRETTIAKLRASGLEWARIFIGQVADSFGTPHIKSHMGVFAIHVDIANRAAAIPGTGNDLISFSYSYDIARFVEAALELPQWEEQMFCYSDTCTYNQVLKLAEEATGSKFTVAYDSLETLEKGEMTELPTHVAAYRYVPKKAVQGRFALFGLIFVNGLGHLPEEKSLNSLFPQIKTKTVEEVISVWKGK